MECCKKMYYTKKIICNYLIFNSLYFKITATFKSVKVAVKFI